MTTVLKININDLSVPFFQELIQKFQHTTEVEIRIPKQKAKKDLFTEIQFWKLINALDWSQSDRYKVIEPAVRQLAAMPIVNCYLFADKLAEKLYQLDTRAHGDAYLANEADDYLSVDDFLYVRCSIVAEGLEYYETILKNPAELTENNSFEALLSIADDAYKQKTGKDFDYHATYNYETYSNKKAWK
jgi:Protein of unknown function (DUF4240)